MNKRQTYSKVFLLIHYSNKHWHKYPLHLIEVQFYDSAIVFHSVKKYLHKSIQYLLPISTFFHFPLNKDRQLIYFERDRHRLTLVILLGKQYFFES